jgi:hypothetical protein
MMRNIHFFNLKDGVDREVALGKFAEIDKYLLENGCRERRTFRLYDAHSRGEPAESAEFINESLWPDLETAQRVTGSLPDSTKETIKQLTELVDLVKTVRYVDL